MAKKKGLSNNQKIEQLTDKLIAKMEEGKMNWNKPWNNIAGAGMTCNYLSKRPYRGINLVMTMFSGFSSPYYLTFKQVVKLKGNVIKGSKATRISFWKPIVKTVEDEVTGEKKTSKFLIMQEYNVFNADQIEGIDFEEQKIEDKLNNFGTVDAIENLVNEMEDKPNIDIRTRNRACYSPTFDKIEMPEKGQFKTLEEYYSTLIHELVHSTGHTSRLDRLKPSFFGSHDYSFEELVAELGSAFILSLTGVACENTEKNSAAYLQGWVSKFKEDKLMLHKAASQAQKAVDFILNEYKEYGEEEEK